MRFGIDFAWSHPSIAAMKAAGVTFVCRYLSHDTSGKSLTHAEAKAYSDAGIDIVVVWEDSAQAALLGYSKGVTDAREALRQAEACGMPAGRPIYFAVDFDASASNQGAIDNYLRGCASVLGVNRVGIYGGFGPDSRAMSDGVVKWLWQTYAWSGGRWDSRAQLQQYSNAQTVGGKDCDFNHAVKADFGQWRIGVAPVAPVTEDDIPVGKLNKGVKAVTSQALSVPQGHKGLRFLADNGMEGSATIRVATRDDKGWTVTNVVTLDSSKGASTVAFPNPATVQGFSVVRLTGENVDVGWCTAP